MKKGSSTMWWIIIGAVLALVVMIILLLMFSSKTNLVNIGLADCLGKSGTCVASPDQCPPDTLYTPAFSCEGNSNGPSCCIGL